MKFLLEKENLQNETKYAKAQTVSALVNGLRLNIQPEFFVLLIFCFTLLLANALLGSL